MKPSIGRLHVITDFYFQQRHSHADLTQMAIDGGADTVQFRQKSGSIRDLVSSAASAREVCAKSGVCFLVNDRVDVACAVDADGVHLGQEDMPIEYARHILGENAIIGITTPSLSLALQAQAKGANYVGFGPVYPTRSKSSGTPVQGLESVLELSNALDIPLIAIAGITPQRCCDVLRAGAHGVAVLSGICLADDPLTATRQFREKIESTSARV